MSQGLTADDIVRICKVIARKDKLNVLLPYNDKRGKMIASPRLQRPPSSPSTLRNRVFSRFRRRNESESGSDCDKINSTVDIKCDTAPNYDDVQGLGDMTIVSVAILVDEHGKTIKTYTEFDDIPVETADSAHRIFLSRMPTKNSHLSNHLSPPSSRELERRTSKEMNGTSSSGSTENGEEPYVNTTEPLVEILDRLSQDKRKKLLKKMRHLLPNLHTTDIKTAIALLDTPRFSKTRSQFKSELIAFMASDMRMGIAH